MEIVFSEILTPVTYTVDLIDNESVYFIILVKLVKDLH